MPSQTCPACHQPTLAVEPVALPFRMEGIAAHQCLSCASTVMVPPPEKDYATHTSDEIGVRNYVEMNCAIDGLVSYLLPALASRTPDSFLDIGCGYGFSLDIVRRLTDARVLGVDPAHYGRLGAQAFGITILAEILKGTPQEQTNPLLSQPFDMIFSSEVVEHINDPDTYLKMIRSFLKPGGLAVITTPRAEALGEDRSSSEKHAVVSPTAHVFLYSAQAFENALARAGFRHIEIRNLDVTQIAYVSDQPFTLAGGNVSDATETYLTEALENTPLDTPLGIGLANRLLRTLVQAGEFDRAQALANQIEFRPVERDVAFRDYGEFLASYRACEACLWYHHAMVLMNHRGDFEAAANGFITAFRFCQIILRIASGSSVVEADLLGLSVFHAMLAAHHARRPELVAAFIGEAIAVLRDPEMPSLPARLRKRISDELPPEYHEILKA